MVLASMNKNVAVILVLIVLAISGLNNRYIGVNKDDVLVIETPAEPRGLDPATNYETTGGNIIYNVYETLISYNGSSTTELIPLLATVIPSVENGLISPDGINYTFLIRQNVHFHNGDLLTAEDVVYSFHRVIIMAQSPSWMITQVLNRTQRVWALNDTEVAAFNAELAAKNITDIRAVPGYTVRFRLTRPYSPFLFVLTHTVASIVNRRAVEEHGGIVPNMMNSWMNEHMVGTGPWKLKEWKKDRTKLVLDRFDDYWGEKARLRQIIILKVDQMTTRVIDLQMGYADVAYVPTTSLDEVIGKEGIVVDKGMMRLAGYFICLNCQRPPFDDVRIRQAVTYAFDYDAMLNVIYKGLGERYVGPWVHGMYGYNESLEPYDQDVEKARQLVEEYKWDTGTSTIEIALFYTVSEISNLLAQQFKSNCEAVGISVTLQFLSWPILLQKTDTGDFDACLLGWLADFPHPDGNAPIVMWKYRGSANNAWYNNSHVDAWLEEAQTTTNETRRLQLYHMVQAQVKEDCPYVWTIQPNSPAVFRSWVKNYVEALNPFMGRYYARVYKDK